MSPKRHARLRNRRHRQLVRSIHEGMRRLALKHPEACRALERMGRFDELIIHEHTVKRAEVMVVQWEAVNGPTPYRREPVLTVDGQWL